MNIELVKSANNSNNPEDKNLYEVLAFTDGMESWKFPEDGTLKSLTEGNEQVSNSVLEGAEYILIFSNVRDPRKLCSNICAITDVIPMRAIYHELGENCYVTLTQIDDSLLTKMYAKEEDLNHRSSNVKVRKESDLYIFLMETLILAHELEEIRNDYTTYNLTFRLELNRPWGVELDVVSNLLQNTGIVPSGYKSLGQPTANRAELLLQVQLASLYGCVNPEIVIKPIKGKFPNPDNPTWEEALTRLSALGTAFHHGLLYSEEEILLKICIDDFSSSLSKMLRCLDGLTETAQRNMSDCGNAKGFTFPSLKGFAESAKSRLITGAIACMAFVIVVNLYASSSSARKTDSEIKELRKDVSALSSSVGRLSESNKKLSSKIYRLSEETSRPTKTFFLDKKDFEVKSGKNLPDVLPYDMLEGVLSETQVYSTFVGVNSKSFSDTFSLTGSFQESETFVGNQHLMSQMNYIIYLIDCANRLGLNTILVELNQYSDSPYGDLDKSPIYQYLDYIGCDVISVTQAMDESTDIWRISWHNEEDKTYAPKSQKPNLGEERLESKVIPKG